MHSQVPIRVRDGDQDSTKKKKIPLENVEKSSLSIIPWSRMDPHLAISVFDRDYLYYKPTKFQIQVTSGY